MISNAVKELQSAKQQLATQINGLEQQAKKIDQAIAALSGITRTTEAKPAKKKFVMSPAHRKALIKAQKARWAKHHANKVESKVTFSVPKGFKRKYIGDARPPVYWGWNAEQKQWIRGIYPGKIINKKTAPVIGPINPSSEVDPNKLIGKRKMSAASRKAIAKAVRARWAKIKAGKVTAAKPVKKKYKMSAAAKANLSAFQKARWAKINAAKKK